MGIRIRTIVDKIDPTLFGNKAYWLSWLHVSNYNVPYGFFISDENPTKGLDNDLFPFYKQPKQEIQFKSLLSLFLTYDGKYDVAIRSSASCEDTQEKSYAGHFLSILGIMTYEEVLANIVAVAKSSFRDEQCNLGIIIQKRIDAQFAGVIFSSNPITGSKKETVISIVKGNGEKLVSGTVEGENIIVNWGEKIGISSPSTSIDRNQIEKVSGIAKEIENTLGYAVDIEWCIDKTGELFLLQCRPVTNKIATRYGVFKVNHHEKSFIPEIVSCNRKISLRLDAEAKKIIMSKAFLVISNQDCKEIISKGLGQIFPSTNCMGYSIVLIYPNTLEGKVLREFTSFESLTFTVLNMISKGLNYYWEVIVIIQEILDSEYTGIIQKVENRFVVELARGYFPHKGVIPVSRYIFDKKGNIQDIVTNSQDMIFRIERGKIIYEKLAENLQKISLSSENGFELVNTFSSLIVNESTVLEFGILNSARKAGKYLLIDSIDIQAKPITIDEIATGVISRGVITGELAEIKISDSIEKIDIHYQDQFFPNTDSSQCIIFLCDRPDISLLNLLHQHSAKNIGFVFKQGSILSHLSITLRENGIPALLLSNWSGLLSGMSAKLDCNSPTMSAQDRLKVIPHNYMINHFLRTITE
jgi:hypothetical protein